MTLETKKAESQSIDIVTIKAPDSSPVNKHFMLFGEHPRELISPESSLHFIKTLCGEAGNKERARAILHGSEFQIIVNGNPESRKIVEEGDTCLRANPNGVDLNRNWAKGWEPAEGLNAFAFMSQTSGGTAPFSEPETRLFKELVSAYKPTSFLSIHSGTKGMYMPWAYNTSLATRNQVAMMDILEAVDKDHCECPFGATGIELGYTCAGSSLDWVYDALQTPYAFTFEIYGDPSEDEELKDAWNKKMTGRSDFVQVRSDHRHHSMGDDDDDCFSMFNPDTKKRYDSTIQNWSAAYLDVAELVANNLKKSVF